MHVFTLEQWKIERELIVSEIKHALKYDEVSKLVELRAELVHVNKKIKGI